MIVCYTSDAFTDNVVFMANVHLQKATSSEYNASVVNIVFMANVHLQRATSSGKCSVHG